MPRDPRSGTAKTKADKLFALLVKERADWTCEHTGKKPPEVQVQCAHVLTRGRKAVRWDGRNAFCLSAGSHMYFTDHPFEWVEWVTEKLGAETVAQLRVDSNQTETVNADKLHAITLHLKRELDIMRERRALGERGRIEFKNWDGVISAPAPKPKAKPKKPSKYKRTLRKGTVLREVA